MLRSTTRRRSPRATQRRRPTLLLGGALVVIVGGAGGRTVAAEPLPNVLLITADDLDADSAGWMGNPLRATPRLDTLAAASRRFVNAHVTAPICQPSRAALLTGRVPHRSGATGFGPIADDVPTLVEVLRTHGYFTAAINKLAHMQPAAKFPWDLALNGSGRRPRALGAAVTRCLGDARRAGRPFLVNVNITDPHRPFRGAPVARGAVPLPGFLEDLPAVRRELARYYASVARLDTSLGEVLDALDDSGHGSDTVVVFLSDNGPSLPFAKASVYRHGTWSPVLLRHPRIAPAVHDELVSSVDLMPTLLELLGVAPPPGMDGRSWVGLLRGETQAARDHVVTHVNTVNSGASYPQRAVRTRTRSLLAQPWAEDGHATFQVEAMHGVSWAALAEKARHDPAVAARVRQFAGGVPLAFYDLQHDPDERRNLIDDPAYHAEIAALAQALVAHMNRTGDPLLPRFRALLAGHRATAAVAHAPTRD